jgi:uncharacterized protein (DUF1499 family)
MRGMKRLRAAVFAIALLAFLAMCVAGPGTRLGLWSWQAGIGMMRIAAFVGIGAAILAAALVLLLLVPRWRARPALPTVALCLAIAAFAPPMILLAKAKQVPPIHDITTDIADPPAFEALREARAKSPNGFAYKGEEVARQQQQAYADIKPGLMALPPREAMQRALDAARSMGWEVVAVDAAAGRLEATDTTAWFGFKDDVVVRIRPEGSGSRVDVRSMSRVGRSDLGANAARVRGFLARLT